MRKQSLLALALVASAPLSAAAQGRQPAKTTASKARTSAGATQPAGADKAAAAEVVELRKVVQALDKQVEMLRKDLERRSAADASTLETVRLLLIDERVARLKREVDDARDRANASARHEEDVKRRLANITNDVILYGGVNREDSERVVRAALNEALQNAQRDGADARAEVRALQNDLADAQQEAGSLRKTTRAVPRTARAASPDDASTPADEATPETPADDGTTPDAQQGSDDFPDPLPPDNPDARPQP